MAESINYALERWPTLSPERKLALVAIFVSLVACSSPPVINPVEATRTTQPSTLSPVTETSTPTETREPTEVTVSEPTAAEVADFTPENIPDTFIHFNNEWTKTTIEENGEQIDVWLTEGEGMENVRMRFVTLYEHYIKDMFIEETTLGRFHLLLTPEAPFRVRFANDSSIGEKLISQFIAPEIYNTEPRNAVLNGAEVYVVYGSLEKNKLPNKGGADSLTKLYSEDGSEIIGEVRSNRFGEFSQIGAFLNREDESVVLSTFMGSSVFRAITAGEMHPIYGNPNLVNPVYHIAESIISAARLSQRLLSPTNYDPIVNYLNKVMTVEPLDS